MQDHNVPSTDAAIVDAVYSSEIKKSMDANPDSLDMLLSAETIDNLFMLDELTRERMIASLRKYAQQHKFSLRSFDSITHAAKKAYRPEAPDKPETESNQVPATKPIKLPNIPLEGLVEPGDWLIDKTGRIIKITPNENVVACPHPVIISARLHDVDFNDEKLAVSFYRDKHWSTISAKRSITASRTAIVQLADSGIQVTSENSKDLVTYLYELETCNSDVVPYKKSIGRLGWVGDHDFYPYDSSYAFDGENEESAKVASAVIESGDYDTWKATVNQYRHYHPLVRALLDASFSSPLLKLLGNLCYCIHIWGKTGTAKTVALYCAMSVWGDPEALTHSMFGTQVGFEKMAALYNSLPLALDERETAQRGTFDDIIYQLTEGRNKLRGAKGGGLQRLYHWNLSTLTTGEYPIISERSKSGARNRTIELNCSESLFENPVLAASIVKSNYGFAGREWIRFIQSEQLSTIRDLYSVFYQKFSAPQTHEDKQVASISAIVLADYLSSINIFGINPLQAEAEAYQLGDTLLSMTFTKAESDQTNNAWEYINDWLVTNSEHFKDAAVEPWGIMEGTSDIYILGSVFTDALKSAGFDSPRGVAQGFRDKGFLIPYEKDNRIQCKKRIGGRSVNCYHLKIE